MNKSSPEAMVPEVRQALERLHAQQDAGKGGILIAGAMMRDKVQGFLEDRLAEGLPVAPSPKVSWQMNPRALNDPNLKKAVREQFEENYWRLVGIVVSLGIDPSTGEIVIPKPQAGPDGNPMFVMSWRVKGSEDEAASGPKLVTG